MKKLIAINLIALILIFFSQPYIFASVDFGKSENFTQIQEGMDSDNFDSLWEEGTVTTYGEKTQKNVTIQNPDSNKMGTVKKLLCRLILSVPTVTNKILSQITSEGKDTFTIENLLSNKYDLFNLTNIIDNSNMSSNNKKMIGDLGTNVAIWFVSIRNLAIVASALTLIYIGIRLATATTATKQAEYKKILLCWVESVVILFILQVFIIVILNISNYAVTVLGKSITNQDVGYKSIEERIVTNISSNLDQSNSASLFFLYTIMYVMIIYYQLKFFLLYFFRLIKVSFLIIISPLVCVTYSIDKVGDGTAQAFYNWIKEIVIATFIQPIHLVVYMFFIFSAGEILVENKLLGILFFSALSQGEKIFKSVLRINPNPSTSKTIDNIL